MYTKMAMSVHYSYLRGPHTIFVLVRKWYGGGHQRTTHKKSPRFLGGSLGCCSFI